MIYFDNAATTFPKPAAVQLASMQYFQRLGANPGRGGYQMSMDTSRKMFDCRQCAADFFGMKSAEQVVFTSGCTQSLNVALKGIVRKGDHLLISDVEHNSVLRPVHKLAEQGIITYTVVPVCLEDPWETVRRFEKAMTPNTRLLAVTHSSNLLGTALPVKELAELAHRAGALILVDAAQSAGILPVLPERDGLDYVAVPGHKGLYGPTGTGLLLIREGAPLPESLTEGGTGSYSVALNPPKELPDYLESGTLNTMGILGLEQGIAFVQGVGREKIAQKEAALAFALAKDLRKIPGLVLYSPMEGVRTAVLALNLQGVHSETVAAFLGERGIAVRGGLHCAPLTHKKLGTLDQGAVRASLGYFNSAAQAESLCRAMEEASKKLR